MAWRSKPRWQIFPRRLETPKRVTFSALSKPLGSGQNIFGKCKYWKFTDGTCTCYECCYEHYILWTLIWFHWNMWLCLKYTSFWKSLLDHPNFQANAAVLLHSMAFGWLAEGPWVQVEMKKVVGRMEHSWNISGLWMESWYKHVRCNPDVAPRLTSGGYEDKVHVITPINGTCTTGRTGTWG